VLTQLRLAETTTVPDGDYGERTVGSGAVLTPGAYQLWRQDEKKDYELVDEGTTSLSEIPFSVAYTGRVGLLESRPPMRDIADLNLKSYQVQSDLDNQPRISAVPLLASYGFPPAPRRYQPAPVRRWHSRLKAGLSTHRTRWHWHGTSSSGWSS
jgi:hypothetical protein